MIGLHVHLVFVLFRTRMTNGAAMRFTRLGSGEMVSGMAAIAPILYDGVTGKTACNLLSRFFYLTALLTQIKAVGMCMATLSTGTMSFELLRMTFPTDVV